MESFDKIIISTRRTSAGTDYKIEKDSKVVYFSDNELNLVDKNGIKCAIGLIENAHKYYSSYETKSKS